MLAVAVFPSLACAAPGVALRARLQPETLGGSTTVSISFQIAASGGQAPPPLSSFAISLPTGMGFAATTLGVATCSEAALLAGGAAACPRDSVMGSGSALVEAPFGAQTVYETAQSSIFMSQSVDGHTTMLLYFDGLTPVIAAFVLQTEIVPGESSFSSVLDGAIPQIPTTFGAADISMRSLHAIIGPSHLLYYKRVHGRTVAYRPVGLNVPEMCPRSGFLFAGQFDFQDGDHVTARSIVACPRHGRQSGGRFA